MRYPSPSRISRRFSRCTAVDLTHLSALPAGILPDGLWPFDWQIDRPACENKWSVFRASSGAVRPRKRGHEERRECVASAKAYRQARGMLRAAREMQAN
jgi:hypothetical protein